MAVPLLSGALCPLDDVGTRSGRCPAAVWLCPTPSNLDDVDALDDAPAESHGYHGSAVGREARAARRGGKTCGSTP